MSLSLNAIAEQIKTNISVFRINRHSKVVYRWQYTVSLSGMWWYLCQVNTEKT